MSNSGEEEKPEPGKTFPLDLASKIGIKTLDCKTTPVVMTGQPLRNMRVVTPAPGQNTVVSPAIITTNIVSQAIIKQCEVSRPVTGVIGAATIGTGANQPSTSSSGIALQRPTQIAIATTTLPVVAATSLSGVSTAQHQNTSYHVPRGPAVVANLSAPRGSNVSGSIRTPMVAVAQSGVQSPAFVRPSRTPSPAQTTAWLATSNAANGSQHKGASTVLSSPLRGASVTAGKTQMLAKTQPTNVQPMPTIRPTTAFIHSSAISIGQGAQIHPYKSAQGVGTTAVATGIQSVTLTPVIPSRTQTLVYSAGGNTTSFVPTSRLSSTLQNQQRQITTSKPVVQATTARLAMPINANQSSGGGVGTARLLGSQVITAAGTKIAAVPTTQQQQGGATAAAIIGASAARVVSSSQTQSNAVALGRLAVSVAATPVQVTNPNLLAQARISTLLPVTVMTANSNQTKVVQAPAKVITQGSAAAIHLQSQIPAVIKSASSIATTASRTINLQSAAMVTQRSLGGAPQTVSISKVLSHVESPQPTTNIFIHTPVAAAVPRKTSPGPVSISQASTTITPATANVSTYSLSNNYYYDARSFNQQSSFATVPQTGAATQQIRSNTFNPQVHSLVTNQPVRFNPVMVVDASQGRIQQPHQQQQTFSQQHQQQLETQDGGMPLQHVISSSATKITSSPRPSILRKRDNEGTLKAAKNLTPQLGILQTTITTTTQPLISPSRLDSGENGNSSGGSTTLSATSSPGVAEVNEDSMPHAPLLNTTKEEEEAIRPLPEISPRKKPRKQQLTGNDIDDHLMDDLQFISDQGMMAAIKKELVESDDGGNQSDEGKEEEASNEAPLPSRVVRKPTTPSLLNSYRQTWKATHNHYLRYSDVKPKDERRPTIMDLSNQYRVLDKVNGWKIHHLSTQMEDLADQEQRVYEQLTKLLKDTEEEEGTVFDKDVNRINELIKGNLQRIKIINDGMIEAKNQMMKVFNHKVHVTDIISRCASKRNFKKREKS